MLLHELSHRVKNTLAVVQAITHQTLRNTVSSEVLDVLEMRLEALSRTHDLLLRDEWRGASLEALAREQLAPYLVKGHERVDIKGPAVILAPALATPLGLVLHELCTNAAKYGALRVPEGAVRLTWETRDLEGDVRVLRLIWSERGGPRVTPPKTLGAGFQLIDHGIADVKVTRDFKPDGFVCTLTMPLKSRPAPV